ncbi:chaperone protein dnaJ 11, chloroplastic-like [Carya illinoinensis]|uniref:J domain-containing protein n=1 Tax=Carya illinoinensis TaxID=32201 RepID=A0A8T1QEA0_CARIL|nr:chaperone protein dnaJ 11, chloroplastic-like [Carya illinoinensis]KAG6652910.1 hypothetical protein CIPAW_05G038200 [Carya illinoinensis]
MAVLLSSSHCIGAKPFLSDLPVLPSKRQRPRVQFVGRVSCRASSSTKVPGENHVNTTNFYEVLSLSPNNASINEIKKAYRSMALRYHPDVCPPPMKEESTRMFVKLNAAYRTLSDPVLRKEYESMTANYWTSEVLKEYSRIWVLTMMIMVRELAGHGKNKFWS